MFGAVISGCLVADPTERTSAAGKTYATANVRVGVEGSEAVFCSIVAFEADAVRALLALSKGDVIAASGRARLDTWQTKAGEQRHGLSLIADQVMSAYVLARKREKAHEQEEVPA